MKSANYGVLLITVLALGAHAQQQPVTPPNSATPAAGTPPPGLEQRQQLPPGLTQRGAVPPVPGQSGVVASPYGSVGTNAAAANGLTSVSNQLAGTNQAVLTSAPGATNRVYITNPWPASATARSSGVARQDQATTVPDQNLLVSLRKRIPVVASAATMERLHFISREGVVTLLGEVPTERESQRIIEFVQRTPGVVQVVNQLQIISEGGVDAGLAVPAPQAQSAAVGALPTNTFTVTNSFGLILTNRGTSYAGPGTFTRTNTFAASTNVGVNTNLSPTGVTNADGRIYPTNEPSQSLPPGLRKREVLPPGLEKRDELPPGLQDRSQSGR